MEIILVKQSIEQEEAEATRAQFDVEGIKTDDMLIENVEEFKVGNICVRVKTGGRWYNWPRRALGSIVIDGTVYPLHGDQFARINCVLSEEELNEEKKRETERAAAAKKDAQDAADAVIAGIDAVLEDRLDRLDREFLLQIS